MASRRDRMVVAVVVTAACSVSDALLAPNASSKSYSSSSPPSAQLVFTRHAVSRFPSVLRARFANTANNQSHDNDFDNDDDDDDEDHQNNNVPEFYPSLENDKSALSSSSRPQPPPWNEFAKPKDSRWPAAAATAAAAAVVWWWSAGIFPVDSNISFGVGLLLHWFLWSQSSPPVALTFDALWMVTILYDSTVSLDTP